MNGRTVIASAPNFDRAMDLATEYFAGSTVIPVGGVDGCWGIATGRGLTAIQIRRVGKRYHVERVTQSAPLFAHGGAA